MGEGELWNSSDEALVESMGSSGAYMVIRVVQVPTPHSAIECSNPKKGPPMHEVARGALTRGCLLTALPAAE